MSQLVHNATFPASKPEKVLLMLTRDAARTFPSCGFKLGMSKFNVNKRLQRNFPNLNIKELVRRCGGKSRLKDVFNEERSRFAA